MAIPGPGGLDTWWVDDLQSPTPNPMLRPGTKLASQGQTSNTSAGNVANMGIGTMAVGAMNPGDVTSVIINDTTITTKSLIFCTLGQGTTFPASGARATVPILVAAPTAGQVVVDLCNLGSASTLSTDLVLRYLVIN